jgi:aldose sugar dehydrogenase
MIRSMIIFFCISFLVLAQYSIPARSQTVEYETRSVSTDLNVPWEIRWGHDNNIWFTERAGRFSRVNPETGDRKVLLQESEVYSYYELGMLGFDFHPHFPDSPYIYIVYTYADSISGADTTLYFEKVVRYRYTADTLVDKLTIIDSIKASQSHNGSRVVVGPDEKLYITTGETYVTPELAQMDESPNGKTLRINLDGSIPEDNPWKGSPVWTKGHRNPQGLTFGPDGTLYLSEHMTWHDDEINIILKGRNYGWPVIEGPTDDGPEYKMKEDSNCVDPMTTWTPTIAPTGIEYYSYDRFPQWKHSLLMTSLINQSLWHVKLDSTGQIVTGREQYHLTLTHIDSTTKAGRLRDLCISPDGRIFISTSNTWVPEYIPDMIFELMPKKSTVNANRTTHALFMSPNPAKNYITISGLPSSQSVIEIVDQLGRKVRSFTSATSEMTVSVKGIVHGAYYVRVAGGGSVRMLPVIIE